MDITRISSFISRNKGILVSLQKFLRATRSSKSNPQKIKTIRGLTFLCIGLLLAFTAHHQSHTLGATAFDHTTWPPEESWRETLLHFKLQPLNASEHPELLRDHPNPFPSQSAAQRAIWIANGGEFVYVADSPFQKHQPELWAWKDMKALEKGGTSWTCLGMGTSAFNSLVHHLKEFSETRKLQKNSHPKSNIVDPKEIHY